MVLEACQTGWHEAKRACQLFNDSYKVVFIYKNYDCYLLLLTGVLIVLLNFDSDDSALLFGGVYDIKVICLLNIQALLEMIPKFNRL